MREIVLDTETTGINPGDGHRIIEIAALELIHHLPSGNHIHFYINPERDIDDGAGAVHGLTSEFLSDKPVFSKIVNEFIDFIGDSPLIIHNASFDIGFINSELDQLHLQPIPIERAIDTLALARKKFPGAPASLDALCRRFEIDNSHRDLHGALVDVHLLASVYIELLGGRQPGLSLTDEVQNKKNPPAPNTFSASDYLTIDAHNCKVHTPRPHEPTSDERAEHNAFLAYLKEPIWLKD